MNDAEKTREELVAELSKLRERNDALAERLELIESSRTRADERVSHIDEDLRIAHLLAEAAAEGADTQAVARILAQEIQLAFDARSTSLYIVSHDRSTLEMQTIGLRPGLTTAMERLIGARVPLARVPRSDESFYWRALRLNETQVFRESSEIESVLREFAASSASSAPHPPPPEGADGVIKLLAFGCMVHVPLVARGRQLGLLVVSAHDQYSDEDVARLTAIGPHVASILAATQAEQDWRRERERADTYLSQAPGFLLVLDDQGRVTAISHGGCEILGLPEREIIGRDWAESFVPERFRQSAVGRVSATLAGGPDEIFDGHALTARGDERIVRWQTTGLRDSGGKVTSLLATGVDLTRVVQSEEREARNRRRYRALIEHSTDLTVVLDARGVFTYVSPSAEQILGFTPSEMLDKQAGDFVHPDDLIQFAEAFADASSQPGVSRSNAMRVKAKNGSWIVLEGRANLQLSNPDIEGMILNLRDVTDRDRVEESIEHSAARFRALIENSHELMLVLAPDLMVRYASPSCSRDLGYSSGALQGVSFEELVHGADLDRTLFRASGANDHPSRSVRMRLRTEDRRWLPYDVTITAMLESPAISGFIINATYCPEEWQEPESA